MNPYEKSIQKYLQYCQDYLVREKQQLSLAESCTGGWISKCITDYPGASAYYWGGVCSYANAAKESLLQVPPEHLEQFGAVSAEVAQDMAVGVQRISKTTFSLAVTGIAGPDGGSDEKPVGLVYIAAVKKDRCVVKKCLFQGNRSEIRLQTIEAALKLLWEQMQIS